MQIKEPQIVKFDFSLFDHTPALIAVCTGRDLVCEYANAHFLKITGRSKRIFGQPILNVFKEIIGQPAEEILLTMYRTGESFTANSFHVKIDANQDGIPEDFWLNVLVQPIKNELGVVTGLLLHGNDVSEAVVTHQKLSVSEKLYEDLKGIIPGMTVITDAKGSVKFYSELWRSFLSQPLTQIEDLFEVIHAFDLNEFKKLVYNANAHQNFNHAEIRVRMPGGGYEWHVVNYESAGVKADERQMIFTLTNIHWQRAIPEFLSSQLLDEDRKYTYERELLHSVIDATEDVFVLFDADMRYKLVNSKLEQVINIKREELIDQVFIEKFPALKDGVYYQDLQRSLKGEVVRNERFYSALTGKWFQNNFYPVRNNTTNEVTGVVFVGRDITPIIENELKIQAHNQELNRIKNFLTELIDTSVELIMLVDKNLIIQMTNKRFEAFVGKSREQIVGQHLLSIHPGYNGSLPYQSILKAMTGEVVHLDRRRSLAREDVFLDTYYIPQFDNGAVVGVLVMSRDISDIVRYKRELERQNHALQNVNKELRAFSYIASHDLQEPLRKIKTFIDLIPEEEKTLLSERSRDYFNRVNIAAVRMQGLIQDLLAYAQVETEVQREEIDLNEVLAELTTAFDNVFIDQKAKIKWTKMPKFSANKLQISQLFYNLIANSIKYAHKDRVCEIEISCHTCDLNKEEDPFYLISVKDNGIGFENEHAEKIFEMFQRLHGRSAYNGNGIGLAICRRIVENHNGRIEASGVLGEGALFNIYLPKI